MKTNFIFNLKLQLMTRLWGREGAARECQCNKTGGQFTIDRLSVRYRQNISRIAALFLLLVTMSVSVWGADATVSWAITTNDVKLTPTVSGASAASISSPSTTLTFTGLSTTSSSKSGYGKPFYGSDVDFSATNHYVEASFVVAPRCTFTPSSLSLTAYSNDNNTSANFKYKVTITDGTTTITSNELFPGKNSEGSITFAVGDLDHALSGTVKIRLHVYGVTNSSSSPKSYLKSPFSISGVITDYRDITGTGSFSYVLTSNANGVALNNTKFATISSIDTQFSCTTLSVASGNQKSGYSGQITGHRESGTSDNVAVHFVVADGYTFAPTDIDVTVFANSTSSMKAKVVLTDGEVSVTSNEITCSSSADSKITFPSGAFTDKKLSGNVTLYVYQWGVTSKRTYIKSPITITGTVAAASQSKTWSLVGDFNSWSTTANVFSDNTTSVELAAGQTYEFKLNDGATPWFGNNGYMTCLYNQDWVFASGSDNCHISATQGGTYTFTLDASDESNPQLSVTYPDNPTIYLNPNSDWKRDGARFALYAFYKADGETKAEEWFDMTEDCGLYSANVPSKYPQIILCRMNPAQAANNWSNKWNQTDDLNVPQDGNTQYTISGWDKSGSWGAPTTPKYTITFAGNGNTSGSMTNVSNINCGSNVTLAPNAFVKTGYTFSGWNDGSGNVADKATIENITSDITLTAQWTPVEYTITYNGLEGATNTDNPATYTIESTTINFVAPGTRTGYTFKSWDPASIAAGSTGNKAVTASWTAKKSTINFNKNGGTKGQSSTTATYGQAMPTSGWETPEKSGYTFGGYYDQDGGSGTQYYTATGASARTWDKEDSSVTLYAKWTEDSPSGECEEIFHAALTSATAATYTGSKADGANSQISLSSADKGKSGYKFSGSGKFVKITLTENFLAGDQISINQTAAAQQGNMVIYSTSGKSASVVVGTETTDKHDDQVYTITLPSGIYGSTLYLCRTDNNNWNPHIDAVSVCRPTECDKEEATLTWATAPANGTVGDADVTLAVNKGSSTGAVTYTSSNTSVATIVDGTKLHYVAAGTATITANLAGDDTYCPKSIEQSITVSAAPTTYTVTYDGNGKTSGDVPTDSNSPYASGATVTVLGNTGSLAKTDYTFAGWNTAANGSGTDYAAGDNFTISANTTLYAKWTEDTPGGECELFSFVMKNDVANVSLTKKGGANDHLTLTATHATISGGSVEIWNIDGSDGKMQIASHEIMFNGGNAYTKITLTGDVQLQAGDVLAVTTGQTARELWFSTGATRPGSAPTTKCSASASYTVIENDALDGQSTFYIWRNSSSTYFKSLTITRPGCGSKHTITFDKNDGSSTTATQTGVEDDTATPLKAIATIGWTRTGYTFAGWTENADGTGTSYTDGANITITDNKTLYAKWTKNQYTITLDNQSATTAGDASVIVTYGSSVPASINVPAKTKNTFGGYYTETAGGGTQVIDADGHFVKDNEYVKDDGNWKYAGVLTLYAKWTSTVTTYTVTYDANGGTGTMTAAREYEAGETVTIKTNAFTAPSGKEFNGWVVKDASNADVTVTDGKFTMPAKNVTIKAQWKNVDVPTGCNMIFYFAKATDAAAQTPAVEQNTTFFTGVPSGSGSLSTSMVIDGTTYHVTGKHSNATLNISFSIPEEKVGTLYILGAGSSGRTVSLKKGSTVLETKMFETSGGCNASFTEVGAGDYKIVSSANVGLSMLAIKLCDASSGCTAPTINSAEASVTSVCSGTNVTLSASATANEGGALTYQWYKSDNTTAGAAGAEIVVTPDETTTYYCKVTDANCPVATKSSTVTVTVNAATEITTQPASTNVGVGEEASLTIVATGSHLSYQWQQCATVDGEYTNVSALVTSATSAKLLITPSTTGTVYYRCVVSGDCGNVTSSAVSIEAGAAAPTVTWGAAETVYKGEKISVSVTTNTDADFDVSALDISGDVANIVKTKNGKTITATMTVNTDAEGTIDLTFNTTAGTSYGATVNAQKSITISAECPAGLNGVVYTATMTTSTSASVTGGTAVVNDKLSTTTQEIGGVNYYKFESGSKVTLSPTGGFKANDVISFDVCASSSTNGGFTIYNAANDAVIKADLKTALNKSSAATLQYTFTANVTSIYIKRSNAAYLYQVTVARVGSPTELAWNDGETSDGETVNVAPDAANFTIAAVSSNSPGAITYSSSKTSVATINTATGEVDPKAVGQTTITATIATNGCYTTKSITYILNVAADCAPPTITTQPKSAEYTLSNEGPISATALTVAASAGTYQWYINGSDNNTSGSPISGATSASYTPAVTEKGTTYYYCVVTDGYCQTASDVATITVNPAPCALEAPKVIVQSQDGEGGCWTSITLKAVAQDGTGLVGGSLQWYDDGEAIAVGGTSVTLTVTEPGTYYVIYTKDACAQESSNKAYVESKEPQVEKLAPFQYYHAGKDDYSDQMNDRHLFTYKSASTTAPTFTATKNGDAYEWSNLENAVSIVDGKNGVDTVMLSLNDLAGCDFEAGDEVEITITPLTACGAPSVEHRASTTIKVVDSKPTLAFIVSGADGDGTKTKKSLKLNGDFLTGYNKADLKVQTSATAVSEAELPLYTELKKHYNVVPVNGYAQFSKWNYEPFDLTFLTDFVKTDGSSNKAGAKEKVNQLAGIVDFRPMFSTKSFMSGISNWTKLGFTANPVAPQQTQKWMNIVCYAHPMFEQFLEQDDIVLEEQDNGGTEVVFTMLSQGGFDASKGIQGFDLSDAGAFVNVATTHYNAEAGIDTDPETGKKTCHPTSVGDDDKLLVASCERQKNIEARMIMLSVNADATSFLTEEGINVIILSLNYLLETNPINVTDCSFTFLGTNSTDWNTASNWNTGKVPEEKNNVRIAAPCVVGAGRQAHAASVKILKDNYSVVNGIDENGSLTIEPTGALSITGIVSRIEGGQYLTQLPTHVEDLYIQSSASGNGAFIHGDEVGQTKARVDMYSIANGAQGTKDDTPNWQWITTPFNDCNRALSNYAGTWMTEWSNSNHEWSPVIRNDDPVRAWTAYCHTRREAGLLEMQGTLVSTADQTISFNHAGGTKGALSMVGNSWTAPIIISQFKVEDFKNVQQHVTLWNTGYDPEGDNTEYVYGDGDGSVGDHREQGTYVTIPIKVTQELHAGLRVIPSMQAFEVVTTGTGAQLTLNYDQLVRPASGSVNIQPMRAPSRSGAADKGAEGITDRLYMVVKGQHYYDFAYVFENSACSDAYDDGWDGKKNWNSNFDIPQLFVENEAGEWTISTQNTLVGTRFGFFRGEDLTYTITFRYEGNGLYLYDSNTNQYTEVRTGNSYTFQSQSFNNEHRFVLTDYNPMAIPTDVGDVSDKRTQGAEKFLMNEVIYIRKNGRIYDVLGETVK